MCRLNRTRLGVAGPRDLAPRPSALLLRGKEAPGKGTPLQATSRAGDLGRGCPLCRRWGICQECPASCTCPQVAGKLCRLGLADRGHIQPPPEGKEGPALVRAPGPHPLEQHSRDLSLWGADPPLWGPSLSWGLHRYPSLQKGGCRPTP